VTGRIFINYRRGDEPGFAGRLFDRLEQTFEPNQVFIDVDNIPPGHDFVSVIESEVAKCDVLLAIIGRGWLAAADETGARRLDNPDDFVRIEIESALRQGKHVIPVLINSAEMPRPDELPEMLKPLSRRNAVRLTHDRFKADAQEFVKFLEEALRKAERVRRIANMAEQQASLDALVSAAEREKQLSAGASSEGARQSGDTSADRRILSRVHPAVGLGILGAICGAIAFGPLLAWAQDLGNGRAVMWAPPLFAGFIVAFGALTWGRRTAGAALLAGLIAGAAWLLSDWVITASAFIEKTEWETAQGIPAFKYFTWGVANGIAVVGGLSLLLPGLRNPLVWVVAGVGVGLTSILFGQNTTVVPLGVAGALTLGIAMTAVGLGLRANRPGKEA
jgi:hypothetical protein